MLACTCICSRSARASRYPCICTLHKIISYMYHHITTVHTSPCSVYSLPTLLRPVLQLPIYTPLPLSPRLGRQTASRSSPRSGRGSAGLMCSTRSLGSGTATLQSAGAHPPTSHASHTSRPPAAPGTSPAAGPECNSRINTHAGFYACISERHYLTVPVKGAQREQRNKDTAIVCYPINCLMCTPWCESGCMRFWHIHACMVPSTLTDKLLACPDCEDVSCCVCVQAYTTPRRVAVSSARRCCGCDQLSDTNPSPRPAQEDMQAVSYERIRFVELSTAFLH